jgi:hypothetical protein
MLRCSTTLSDAPRGSAIASITKFCATPVHSGEMLAEIAESDFRRMIHANTALDAGLNLMRRRLPVLPVFLTWQRQRGSFVGRPILLHRLTIMLHEQAQG